MSEALSKRLEEIEFHIKQHHDAIERNQASQNQLTMQLHGWMGAKDEINRMIKEIEKDQDACAQGELLACEPKVEPAT